VSDHAVHEPIVEVHPVAGNAIASPEFDRREIKLFGQDDGHAVTVIGQMLVGFFFYSLIVMAVVAAITWWGIGQTPSHTADTHHSGETSAF
jgi:hypothetical protein